MGLRHAVWTCGGERGGSEAGSQGRREESVVAEQVIVWGRRRERGVQGLHAEELVEGGQNREEC
eukprot:2803731-Rhodomonas_salina.3